MTVNTDCSVAPAPIHGVVEFVPAEFKALFPQFGTVADPLLTSYFDLATMIVNNTCRSMVCDATKRERLLNLLVAHICALLPVAPNGGAGSGAQVVGHVTAATEGTVTISAQYAALVTNNMAWFIQTQYGALFWQLTANYRTMRYIPPVQCCGPAGVYAGRRG